MQELKQQILEQIENFKLDLEKATAEKPNKTAARRSRKTSTTLAKLFKEYRKLSLEELA